MKGEQKFVPKTARSEASDL